MVRLENAIQISRRNYSYLFSVLFLDLDEFKTVNDSLGRAFGDQLLIPVAKQLRNCISTEDTVARLGGGEFVFLLEAVNMPPSVESGGGMFTEKTRILKSERVNSSSRLE